MNVRCFWTAPNGRASIELRRLEKGDCPLRPEWKSHWAAVKIDEAACELRASSRPGSFADGSPTWWFDYPDVKPAADDPRWPSACDCGHVFGPGAERFLDRWALYVGSPDGIARRDMDLPVGAVYRVEHREHFAKLHGDSPFGERLGPDGMCLEVVTPWKADGTGRISWCVDSKSANGGFWDRNAIPTDLKPGDFVPLHVSPSIFQNAGGNPPGFHGWLHNGEISSC